MASIKSFMNSLMSRLDIYDILHHARSYERLKGVICHEFDLCSEFSRQVILKLNEFEEPYRPFKLDQKVDIAVLFSLSPRMRAEKADFTDTVLFVKIWELGFKDF